MTFKHDAIVRAWLDGKTIQRQSGSDWYDVAPADFLGIVPAFSVSETFRIKPEKIKARFFKFNDGAKVCVLDYHKTIFSSLEHAIKYGNGNWVGDWFETPFEEK